MTPEEIEAVLAEFRQWLAQAPESAAPGDLPGEPVDLYTLVAQFTALRQEVNLQTRAVRAQQEQSAAALQQLEAAMRQLETPPADASVELLLKALIETADVQILAARELQRVVEAVKVALDAESAAAAAEKPRLPLLGRLLGIGRLYAYLADLERRLVPGVPQAERIRGLVESAAAGLAMGLQRMERTMRQHGLEPIPALGHDFDPESMEALEAAAGSGRPPGEVVEEIRRGYRWNGKIFRYAQVKVAK
jgi:molecular chaperone GrpE